MVCVKTSTYRFDFDPTIDMSEAEEIALSRVLVVQRHKGIEPEQLDFRYAVKDHSIVMKGGYDTLFVYALCLSAFVDWYGAKFEYSPKAADLVGVTPPSRP